MKPCTLYRTEARRLIAQFNWHLLAEREWAEAARQVNPTPADERVTRRACLTVYSQCLYEACQDRARQDQAYGELYDYLWPQACAGDPELANEAAQGAIVLVFEAFCSNDPAKQPRAAATFLRFAQLKLRDALKQERRSRRKAQREVLPDYGEDRDGPEDWLVQIPDTELPPHEQVLREETEAERAQWISTTVQHVARQVLACLEELWKRSRLHHQLSTVIITFMDRVHDAEIATRLEKTPTNVQVLRSRGLDKLRQCLRIRLALGEGGCS